MIRHIAPLVKDRVKLWGSILTAALAIALFAATLWWTAQSSHRAACQAVERSNRALIAVLEDIVAGDPAAEADVERLARALVASDKAC